MLRTLLVAAAVSAAVGNAAAVPEANALDARSNTPPSYFCADKKKKCEHQKPKVTAYCSSYLGVPKVTVYKTKTVESTKTFTETKFTATVTKQGKKIVTSTISSCGPPAITPAPVEEDPGNESGGEEEGNKVKRNSPPTYPPTYPVEKPDCLKHLNDKDRKAACKCYDIKKATKTITKTETKTIHKKTVVKAIKTVKTPTTTYVFPEPTKFLIASDAGGYAAEDCVLATDDIVIDKRGVDSIPFVNSGTLFFDSVDDNAILFELDGTTLTALEGSKGEAFEYATDENGDPDYQVRVGLQKLGKTATPLSCSITYDPKDGTCPLDCTVSADGEDVNLGNGVNDWLLGPAGSNGIDVSYKTFAVTRTDEEQTGGVCLAFRPFENRK